jgi:hypothetical protein
MQNKKLLIAGGVLVVLVGLIAYMANQRSSRDAGETTTAGGASLPDLTGSDITSLTIQRPDAEAITLTRDGETWRVTAPIEADADDNVLRTAIEKLDELEMDSVVARNPSNHEQLEVDDAHGVRLTVRAGEEEVADLYLGATRGGGTLIRVAGQDVVVSARGSVRFAFDRELSAFRNKRILDVAPERVVGLRYQVGERALAFTRGDAEWALVEDMEPIERFGAQRVQAVAATLARLRATEFAAADVTEAAAGLETPAAVVSLTIGPAPAEPEATEDGGVAPAQPVDETVTEVVIVELGGDAPADGQVYVRLRGNPTIYTISRYSADRLRGDVALFQDPEPGAEGEGADALEPPPGLEGMGAPGGAGQQIPEELMRQIQEQMQRQGMGGPH